MVDDDELVERLRQLCRLLPETAEVETLGRPTFRVATNTYAFFERYQGAPVVSVKLALDVQAVMTAREGFEVAADTGAYGWTNIRLDLDPEWSEIDELVVDSYRAQAPDHLRSVLDAMLAAADGRPVPEADE